MTKYDDTFFLLHIAEACEKIRQITDISFDCFLDNEDIQAIAERKFEILGEASKRLSEEFTQRNPHIDWSGMAKFRDIIIHHYFSVNYIQKWNIAKNDVPKVLEKLKTLPELAEAKRKIKDYEKRHDPVTITGETVPAKQKQELQRQLKILFASNKLESIPCDKHAKLSIKELINLVLSVPEEIRKELIRHQSCVAPPNKDTSCEIDGCNS